MHRSKVRLLYLAGQSPFRLRELLESELYSSKEYNLIASRRLSATLRERALSNREVWVASDDPQLSWLLDDVPACRFLRPIPTRLARVADSLKRRAETEPAAVKPRVIVIAEPASDAEKSVELPLPMRPDYATQESEDSWQVFERNSAIQRPPDDSEFCDPNSN